MHVYLVYRGRNWGLSFELGASESRAKWQCRYDSDGNCVRTPEMQQCIHPPLFGLQIKDRCNEAGLTCYLNINGETGVYKTVIDFLLDYVQ